MNEYLLIRLGAQAKEAIDWLVWSRSEQEIIASGTLAGAEELGQLQERAGGRPVIALVPAADLLFREVTLPGRGGRQALKALPYLLEEEVASDVDNLHLVVLEQQANRVQLVAVDHDRMQQWLAWLDAAGLVAQRMLPDVLALPLAAEGWSAVALRDIWLFRTSACSGMQAERSWLAALLQGFDPVPPITSYSPLPENVPGEWRAAPAELPLRLLADGALASKLTLLSGRYRRQPEWQRLLLPWRKVGLAAAVLLLLALGNQMLYLQQLRAEANAVRAQTVSLYQQLFPGERRVINPKTQMKQHLKAADGKGSDSSFVRQLMLLSPVFAQVSAVKPEQLRFDASRNEFRLQATADSYQDFDRFRQLAGEQFTVQPGDMKSEGGKVQGVLLLRSKS